MEERAMEESAMEEPAMEQRVMDMEQALLEESRPVMEGALLEETGRPYLRALRAQRAMRLGAAGRRSETCSGPRRTCWPCRTTCRSRR